MNIYVGNLSYRTTEEELLQAFEAFGKVASARIITDPATGRSRGFGFVEMTEDSEARTAMEALNDSMLGERRLKVNEGRSRPQGPERRARTGGRNRGPATRY